MASKVGITSIQELVDVLPCSKETFYNHFPVHSDDLDEIKDALRIGTIKTKVTIRQKLFKSDNPTALLAVYRMLATQEERDAISMNRTDITTNGKDLKVEPLVVEVIDKREQVDKEEEE